MTLKKNGGALYKYLFKGDYFLRIKFRESKILQGLYVLYGRCSIVIFGSVPELFKIYIYCSGRP